MTPTLHFFCGKPGAGKSTLAARIAREQSAILLSEDVWLMRLYGDQMTTFDDYIRVSRRLRAVVDTPDAVCLQRIARRNQERPEGSHHLTPEDFAHVAAYFQPPGDDEGLQVLRHGA